MSYCVWYSEILLVKKNGPWFLYLALATSGVAVDGCIYIYTITFIIYIDEGNGNSLI